MLEKIRNLENVHIALWLVKDASWVLLFKPLGLIMILPTVAVAIWILVQTWSDLKDRLHNLAVCFWILANSTWMVGEFYFNDSWRPVASTLFCLGISSIAYYYLIARRKLKA